jgi:hypothetical protein
VRSSRRKAQSARATAQLAVVVDQEAVLREVHHDLCGDFTCQWAPGNAPSFVSCLLYATPNQQVAWQLEQRLAQYAKLADHVGALRCETVVTA